MTQILHIPKTIFGVSRTLNLSNLFSEKEDADYWERLNNDRLERFQQGKKRNRNKRGRQKVGDY
jgi:hypothetical protein